MKELSAQNIIDVADLANLEILPKDEEIFLKHLNSLLGFADQLAEVDTSSTTPLFNPISEHSSLFLDSEKDDFLNQNQFPIEAVIVEN